MSCPRGHRRRSRSSSNVVSTRMGGEVSVPVGSSPPRKLLTSPFAAIAADLHLTRQRAAGRRRSERLTVHRPIAVVVPFEVGDEDVVTVGIQED